MKICLPSRFLARIFKPPIFCTDDFFWQYWIVELAHSKLKKQKTKSEKFVKIQKIQNEKHEFDPMKRILRKKLENKTQNLGRKEMKIFFEFKTKQKVFPHQNKTNNKKSHSLCATIMTLYNIVTITTYITIRMSHIPIHHQNLVWKECSI